VQIYSKVKDKQKTQNKEDHSSEGSRTVTCGDIIRACALNDRLNMQVRFKSVSSQQCVVDLYSSFFVG